jgi:hypothetical protein
LFATLLWHEVLAAWECAQGPGEVPIPALYDAMDEVLAVQGEKLAITRRIVGDIKDIWALQPRFDKRAGKSPYRLIELPRFRAGYDFLVLRAESGEIPAEIADWWHDVPERRPCRARSHADSGRRPEKEARRRAQESSVQWRPRCRRSGGERASRGWRVSRAVSWRSAPILAIRCDGKQGHRGAARTCRVANSSRRPRCTARRRSA